MNDVIDYDLHGILGIRLVGATPYEEKVVSDQLGLHRASLSRQPDITIQFRERLHLSSPIRLLGLNDAGFSDDVFLLLQGKQKFPIRVQIPFDQIGCSCEIICERGLTAVPLLIPIINLTMLGKGYLPLHASAFIYNGQGCLITGWAKGGKSETLLAFMNRGAAYVGDEWVYISPDGRRMFGIPEPIRVWQWHLDYLPEYQTNLDRKTQAKMKALDWATKAMSHSRLNGQNNTLVKMAHRVRPLLRKQQYTHLPPLEAFGKAKCQLTGPLDKVFFVISHDSADTAVRPIMAEEISSRMVFSLQDEQRNLQDYYHKFRFAFPECRNDLLENSAEHQRKLLKKALAGKESYVVFHPYPVPIPEMYEMIEPLLGRSIKRTA